MAKVLCVLVVTLIGVGQVIGQLTPVDHVPRIRCHQPPDSRDTIYRFKYRDVFLEETVRLNKYADHVVLVVNVATYCDYTWQYHGMNALQEKFGPDGFRILAFPCNQFGKDQPGANGTEIMNGIKHVRPGNGFRPNFPHLQMVDVNGSKEASVYAYLKKYCPPISMQYARDIHYKPMRVGDIYWNWEKFLVGRDGRVVSRYHASLDPLDPLLVQDIMNLTLT